MSATGNQPLAGAIIALRVAAEGLDVPDDVVALMYAIDAALFSEKPRVTINRRFGKLRQARPLIFQVLRVWLKTPEVRSHMSIHGAYWAWLIWRRAAWKLHRRSLAHAAFGMNIGGRPPNPGFTRAEDAAIYALYLLDTGNAPNQDEAINTATTVYQARRDKTIEALPMAESIGVKGRSASVQHSAAKRK